MVTADFPSDYEHEYTTQFLTSFGNIDNPASAESLLTDRSSSHSIPGSQMVSYLHY